MPTKDISATSRFITADLKVDKVMYWLRRSLEGREGKGREEGVIVVDGDHEVACHMFELCKPVPSLLGMTTVVDDH